MKLSHIAIAVPQIDVVCQKLKLLSLEVESCHEVPSEKVMAAMIPCGFSPQFKLEILEPTSDASPLAKFLEKNKKGGLHHLCFEVENVETWFEVLTQKGIQIIAPGVRKAARGKALFIHPKEMGGVLVELEQIEES